MNTLILGQIFLLWVGLRKENINKSWNLTNLWFWNHFCRYSEKDQIGQCIQYLHIAVLLSFYLFLSVSLSICQIFFWQFWEEIIFVGTANGTYQIGFTQFWWFAKVQTHVSCIVFSALTIFHKNLHLWHKYFWKLGLFCRVELLAHFEKFLKTLYSINTMI